MAGHKAALVSIFSKLAPSNQQPQCSPDLLHPFLIHPRNGNFLFIYLFFLPATPSLSLTLLLNKLFKVARVIRNQTVTERLSRSRQARPRQQNASSALLLRRPPPNNLSASNGAILADSKAARSLSFTLTPPPTHIHTHTHINNGVCDEAPRIEMNGENSTLSLFCRMNSFMPPCPCARGARGKSLAQLFPSSCFLQHLFNEFQPSPGKVLIVTNRGGLSVFSLSLKHILVNLFETLVFRYFKAANWPINQLFCNVA